MNPEEWEARDNGDKRAFVRSLDLNAIRFLHAVCITRKWFKSGMSEIGAAVEVLNRVRFEFVTVKRSDGLEWLDGDDPRRNITDEVWEKVLAVLAAVIVMRSPDEILLKRQAEANRERRRQKNESARKLHDRINNAKTTEYP